jgi:hypothetical protein
MKTIDFSHTGGFPLTQDDLNHLQNAYTECIDALTAMGVGDSTPVIIWGMNYSVLAPGTATLTSGWFFITENS